MSFLLPPTTKTTGFLGLSKTLERFSTSLVKTYEELCRRINTRVDEELSKALFEIGKMPFDINIYKGQTFLPGVQETLDFLVQEECDLKLYTKGIESYQREKMQFFKLHRWFKNDGGHIIIVNKKNPDNLRLYISRLEEACFVTDSSEDVKVGIEAGIKVAQVLPPEIYQDRWGNFDNVPYSPLHHKFNSMLEFRANYHSL